MTLGEKLKSLRAHNKMTQEALAEKVGVSRSAIAKWETNNGVPEIGSLKIISQLFRVSLDDLLDDERCYPSEACENQIKSEYLGCRCDIDLVGWNDGVYDVLIIGEDKDFFFYRKEEKRKMIHGLIGKKFIKSVERRCQCESFENSTANRNYFCNKRVLLEIAISEGALQGFLDFRNDDYLDTVVEGFESAKIVLKWGKEIDVAAITRIEELIA